MLGNEWLGIYQLHALLFPAIVLVCPSGFKLLRAAAPLPWAKYSKRPLNLLTLFSFIMFKQARLSKVTMQPQQYLSYQTNRHNYVEYPVNEQKFWIDIKRKGLSSPPPSKIDSFCDPCRV